MMEAELLAVEGRRSRNSTTSSADQDRDDSSYRNIIDKLLWSRGEDGPRDWPLKMKRRRWLTEE